MGIKVTNGINISKFVEERLDRVESVMKTELEYEVGEIVRRTKSGKDYTGRPFAKYADSTLARKHAKQRVGQAKRAKEGKVVRALSKTVTLWEQGLMLGAMTSKVERIAGQIFGVINFNSGEESTKASDNHNGNASRNKPARKFFAFSSQQIKRIESAIRKALKGE